MSDTEFKPIEPDAKVAYFKDLIELIYDGRIKMWVAECIKKFPDYFFYVAASSSGKYHPKWALGEGGLIRHTRAVVTMARDLSRTFGLTAKEVDYATAAMLIHDSLKYGIEFNVEYHFVHTVLPRSYFKWVEPKLLPDIFDTIMKVVDRHMGSLQHGEWSPGNLKPTSALEVSCHLADYMVSRQSFVFEPYIDEHLKQKKLYDEGTNG